MSDAPAAPRIVYMRAIVDAEGLLRGRQTLPADEDIAAIVDAASDQIVLTSSMQRAPADTGRIALTADVGDIVRIYARTGSNNFEHAALISAVHRTGEGGVVEGFAPVEFERSTVLPARAAPEVSSDFADEDFWFWQGTVTDQGLQGVSLVLALYDRDEAGQPRFAGLYRWGLDLTVEADPPSPASDQPPEEETS